MRLPEYLTPGEVGALYRVDLSTVRKWADAGKIPCFRTPGGHRRYPAAGVAVLRGQTLGQLAADLRALQRGAR